MPRGARAQTVRRDGDGLRTVLLAPAEADAALGRLAARLEAIVGHPVEPCRLEGLGESLVATLARAAADAVAGLVLLPLGLDPEAAERVGTAAARLAERWPALRLHPGRPPDPGDLARILGDRARQAIGRFPGDAVAPADVVVVLAGAGANPGANAELAKLARLVYEAHRFADVGYAFLDVTGPSVGEAITRWATLGARRLVVVPHVLFAGPALRRLRRRAGAAGVAAGVHVAVAGPLAPHPALLRALARRHVEALVGPDLARQLGDAHAHDRAPREDLEARMAALLPPRYRAPGVVVGSAPMPAAPLVRDADGRVAWGSTWESFCELALAGGPPHRGRLLEPVTRDEALGDPAPAAQPPKLLDRLRHACRVRHFSLRTEDAYHDWAERFIRFHGVRHPDTMAEPEVNAFLTHLAVDRRVSASTVMT